jgi:hypothetical protein
VTAAFEITVFNTATQIAADCSVEAETAASAVAALAKELASREACTIAVELRSYFRGQPTCPAT